MSIVKRLLEQGVEELDEWYIREKQLADKFSNYINNTIMPIYAENNGGGMNYEPVPSGLYPARCYSMIEIGTVTSQWEGETKSAKKVRLTFELPTETKVFREENGEQPYSISREFTLSMHEKAGLRKFLEGWRGKAFTEEEAKRFDITVLIGKEAMINVVHTVKDGKTYANISTASPMMKGMSCPPQVNPTTVLSFDNFDFDVYNTLPEFLQNKIAATPEYGVIQAKLAAASRGQAQPQQTQQPQEEDDLPF